MGKGVKSTLRNPTETVDLIEWELTDSRLTAGEPA